MKRRKHYTADEKLSAVLATVRGEKTALEVSQELGCHPHLVAKWKGAFLERAPQLFQSENSEEIENKKLKKKCAAYERLIGKLSVQNDFLEQVLDRMN